MQFKQFALLSSMGFLSVITAYADSSVTFLGPTVHGSYTTTITDSTAFSIAADAGNRNLRASATVGAQLMDHDRFKFSAEYLGQRLPYTFFDGKVTRWKGQAAIGANYEYDLFTEDYRPQVNLGAYLSHVNSSSLGTSTGVVEVDDIPATFTDVKRIAGSTAKGASPGASIELWCGGRLGLDANYDNVRYFSHLDGPRTVQGWGGTLHLQQTIADNVEFSLSAGVRKPFNVYQTSVTMDNIPSFGDWSIGVIGDYVAGKSTLPSSYNISLSFNYFLDQCEEPSTTEATAVRTFLASMAKPAVRMPTVLAVVDEDVDIDFF